MCQKLILIGNVGKKPELRMTATGKPFTTFSLATNKAYKQDGVAMCIVKKLYGGRGKWLKALNDKVKFQERKVKK